MSLISEALKKARQEAARQDALRPGVPYAVGTTDPPRRNPLLPLLAGLGAGCLVAGLLFAVAWIAGWGPFAKPEASPAPQVAQATPAPASPPPAVEIREETPAVPSAAPSAAPVHSQAPAPTTSPLATEPRPTSVPAPPPAAAPQAPVVRITPAAPPPAPPAAETAPSAEEDRPEPAPTEAPANPPPAPSPTPSSGADGGLVDGQVYSGEVPLPGGGSVKLNGIAFSQDRPVAVLDGRVMGPGESIQGFTVVEIESGRVKLQGYGATVFLSPR